MWDDMYQKNYVQHLCGVCEKLNEIGQVLIAIPSNSYQYLYVKAAAES